MLLILIVPEDQYTEELFVARSKRELIDAVTLGFKQTEAEWMATRPDMWADPGTGGFIRERAAELRLMIRRQVAEDPRHGTYCLELPGRSRWIQPILYVVDKFPAAFGEERCW